jgi:two-component system sensor histidine kinase QseC
MLQGLERTVHLAEQMLAFSRAAAPGEAARAEKVALGPLVAEAVDALQTRAAERKVTIHRGGADAAVRGERHKLASLVGNLIDNAVRYGPVGGRVAVELHRAGGTVLLSVEDEGPGVPPELRERVFESYYRIPGSAGAGSGLGLAIVREIAATHGARVAIEDGAQGKGLRVVVRFPAAD